MGKRKTEKITGKAKIKEKCNRIAEKRHYYYRNGNSHSFLLEKR